MSALKFCMVCLLEFLSSCYHLHVIKVVGLTGNLASLGQKYGFWSILFP
jgi:hypothetical protein